MNIPQIKLLKAPWRITFDTNPDDCNLHCIMCEEFSEYSTVKQLRILRGGPKRRRMPIALIEQVLESVSKHGMLREIIPSTMGEPLLYREFDRIIELCHQYDIKLNLTTNGTFPRRSAKEWAELLVPITSDVKISWNGATKETAEKVMKGIDFEKQVQNVKDFIAVRDKIHAEGGNYCRVTFQLTFMEVNVHEFPQIVELAATLGVDRIKGHHLWVHFEQMKNQSLRRSADAMMRWNDTVKKMREAVEKNPLPNGKKIILDNIYELDPNAKSPEILPDAVCPFLGREAWIAWDGRFNPCCAPDAKRRTLGYFGNVSEVDFMEIWNGDGYKKLINNYLKSPVCQECNMRRPYRDIPHIDEF